VNNPNTVSTVSRKFAVISVIILLLIVAVGGVFLYYALDASASPSPKHLNLSTVFNLKNDVNLALNVTVRDPSGKVIASVYQPHDLITNNFYYLMLYPFLQSGYPSSWDVVNTAGTSESVCDGGCTTSLIQTPSTSNPPLLAIGSGTTAPAVTDYKLTTLVTNMPQVATPQTYYGTNSITLTVSSTAVLTTATTISEAGYEVKLNDGNYVLVAHDTFTGVSVPAGGAITLAYQWTFGDSSQVWMVNYMNWIASVVGAITTCVGASLNYCQTANYYSPLMTNTGNNYYYVVSYTISYENPFICVGTGTTAPVWTQYNLASQVGNCVQTSKPSYSAGSDTAYVSASISIPSSSTITEVGLEFYADALNSGYFYFLMLRSTFSGIVVSAGQSVTITIGYQV
jgi:hypothetical protein